MKSYRKLFICGLLVFSSLGCKTTSSESVNLWNLGDFFPNISKSEAYKESTAALKTSLQNILFPAKDFGFISKSLESIKNEAEKLDFKVRYSGGNLVISSGDNTSSKTRVFLFKLNSLKNIADDEIGSSENSEKMGIIPGYQSLYPKGILISLLYAWKDLRNQFEDAAKKIQIVVARDDNSFLYSIPELTSGWDPSVVFMIPIDREYSFSKEKGKLNFQIKIPQETRFFKDVTTKEGEVSVSYYPTSNSSQAQIQNFSLFSKKVNALGEPVTQNLGPLVKFLQQSLKEDGTVFQGERAKVLSAILNFLTSVKNPQSSYPFYSLSLMSFSSEGGMLNFSFQASLKSDFSLQGKLGIKEFLQDFAKQQLFSSLEKPAEGYTITSSRYSPSYNISKDPAVQKLYSDASRAFSKIYHFSTATVSTLSEDGESLSESQFVKGFPSFFMGVFFGPPSFYSHVAYVPEMKLFLDKEYFFYFLSKDLP